MASELVVITDDDGDELVVDMGPGIVGLVANEPGVVLRGAKLDALRELLDRAAMPGQVSVLAYPCCKCCADADMGPCVPPHHLTRCANGCDDATQAVSG